LHDLCALIFLFFQAEDGIRDRNVTGVQTCALPIFPATSDIIYEMVPGFFSHLIVTIVVSLMTKAPSAEVQEEFDRAAKLASIAAQDEDVDFEEAAEKL